MRNIRLPDGSWVTTATAASDRSLQRQCPEDTCTWEDFGPPTPPGLLPVAMQLQQCAVCGFVRGRYLGPLEPPSLKIGDQEFFAKQIYVVAARAEDYPPPPGKPFTLVSCCLCQVTVYIDHKSLLLSKQGARVICLDCAKNFCPDTLAGLDPDTGHKLSLRELLRHPNRAGAYGYDDFQGTTPD